MEARNSLSTKRDSVNVEKTGGIWRLDTTKSYPLSELHNWFLIFVYYQFA